MSTAHMQPRSRKRDNSTHQVVNKRLGKKTKSDAVKINLDIEEFVTTLFSNTPITHHAVRDANIDLARQFCRTVIESAQALEIHDAAIIRKALCYLISYNHSRHAYPDDIYANKQKPASRLKVDLNKRLKWLINITINSNRDLLLSNFLQETDPTVLSKLTILLCELSEEQFHLSYVPDWISIYRFMLSPAAVIPYLDQLELALQAYCRSLPFAKEIPTRNNDGMFILPTDDANPNHQFKILSGFMYQWARTNGFEKRAKLLGGVDARTFYKMLLTRSIFKDCAINIGNEHGAWSHAIQWYAIFEHHKKTAFLSHPPLEVYEEFGDPSQQRPIHQNMWDRMLDQAYAADFTSPEHIMRIAINDEPPRKRPILSETLTRNQTKMFEKYGDETDYQKHLKSKHADDWESRVTYRPL